jgi:hypothetical protein
MSTDKQRLALAALAAKAPAWRAMPLREKADLLHAMIVRVQALTVEAHVQCSRDSARAQCLDPDELGGVSVVLEALVWIGVVKGHLERLRDTLRGLADPTSTSPVVTRQRTTAAGEAGGGPRGQTQIIASVFPLNSMDSWGLQGAWRGELWMTPGCVAPTSRGANMSTAPGGVAVVLGAGNQGFLTVVDMLDCLFKHRECVLVKHHPLRNYQDQIITDIFAPLISRGFVATMLHTTTEDAAEIVAHDLVTHVHMTGGKATHDAILWGPTGQRSERKIAAKMTSELGCVTPWIVLPAVFSEAELQHQAAHLATVVVANNSCNCNAPKAVLLSSEWAQKDEFVRLVKSTIRRLPAGVPYYPGTVKRYEAFQREYSDNSQVMQPDPGVVAHQRCTTAHCGADQDTPFLCIDLEMNSDGMTRAGKKCNQYCLRNEAFAPILAFVTVTPGGGGAAAAAGAAGRGAAVVVVEEEEEEEEEEQKISPADTLSVGDGGMEDFMLDAAHICNACMFGCLSCTVVVHPTVEAAHAGAVEQLIANLRYGVVSLNAWTALSYAVDTLCWGAFPGEKETNVESGVGMTRNTLCFDNVQKSVVRSPLVDKGHLKFDEALMDPGIAPVLYQVTRLVLQPGCGACCSLCGAGLRYAMSGKCMGILGGLLVAAVVVVAVGELVPLW